MGTVAKLKEMKQLLTAELKRFPHRPYGEFIPGGNASPAGAFDDVLEKMRKLINQDTKGNRRRILKKEQKIISI